MEPFGTQDLAEIASLGLSTDDLERQLELFRHPPAPMRLDRPCTAGDGVVRIGEEERPELLSLWEEAAAAGRLTKLVPASGAASRMFAFLVPFLAGEPPTRESVEASARAGDRNAAQLLKFLDGLPRFAFTLHATGIREKLEELLLESGLDYLGKPKGLLQFHAYSEGPRTPFVEHLVEAAATLGERRSVHFTISPQHRELFDAELARVGPSLPGRFEVSFSYQERSTDTIAVDLENRPFRTDEGELLFRPGGHGALLANLQALGGDVVFVKNIDNVVPDARKGPTLLWKRLLCGYALKLRREGHGTDRPLRVCGVVRNQGEPGGGPFWTVERDGTTTRQIVESAQVDLGDPAQAAVWGASTHFNPVDLVCLLRDPEGRPFDLSRFVDPDTVFLAQKTHEGRPLKALERPGLWNGAMARWETFFVEVPLETFAPVKSVLDLLRPEHQAG